MERSLTYYAEVPLMIVAGLLFALSFTVFTAPSQEEQWRLCLIGAFACLLGRTRSPLWFVVNVGCLGWNFIALAGLVWGS